MELIECPLSILSNKLSNALPNGLSNPNRLFFPNTELIVSSGSPNCHPLLLISAMLNNLAPTTFPNWSMLIAVLNKKSVLPLKIKVNTKQIGNRIAEINKADMSSNKYLTTQLSCYQIGESLHEHLHFAFLPLHKRNHTVLYSLQFGRSPLLATQLHPILLRFWQ